MTLRAVALVAVIAAGCGAVGVAAPQVVGAREDTGCPAANDALAHTKAALELPGVRALRPHLERVLVEHGGLRVLIQGLAAMLTDVDQETFAHLRAGLNPEVGLGSLTPHLVEVLRYIDGSSAHVAGAHPEPLAAVHAMLDQCPAPATLSTTRRLLELEVRADPAGAWVLAAPGAGERSWLGAVLDAVRAVASDPVFVAALEDLELEDESEGDGTIRVGRDAFRLLSSILVANLAAPDFDPEAARALLDDALSLRITDPAARAKLDAALDVALLIAEPSADVFPQTQALMGCLNDADEDAAIGGMLYDWLTVDALPLEAFLDDAAETAGVDTATDLRLALVDMLGAVEARPALAGDVTIVLGELLDEEAAPALVSALLAVQGQGALHELLGLVDGVEQCRGLAP
ncbi:MAG: hypothetical protein IT383_08765 [Deltaproteobacteria bacterium]|nr:hypothetical protein [Deltaproteobacteria bacterium]